MDDRYDNHDEWEIQYEDTGASIVSAIVMAVALALLIAAFVWFVIRLDPLTDDFIGIDDPLVTPVATAESP